MASEISVLVIQQSMHKIMPYAVRIGRISARGQTRHAIVIKTHPFCRSEPKRTGAILEYHPHLVVTDFPGQTRCDETPETTRSAVRIHESRAGAHPQPAGSVLVDRQNDIVSECGFARSCEENG